MASRYLFDSNYDMLFSLDVFVQNMYSIRCLWVQFALCAFDTIHYITIDFIEFTQASTGGT